MSRDGLHPLPEGWETRAVIDCVLPKGVENKGSVQQRQYQPSGRFPVVDQGGALIAGFTDEETVVHQHDLPLILFGDHTRVFKFLDFPFATGADGTKLLKPNREFVDAKFLYYALLKLDIPGRGYNRHFKYLKERAILCPSDKAEQRAIATVLSKIQAATEVQQKIVAALKELKAATMAKLFREGTRGERLKRTEIGEIPESWDIVRLGEIAKIGNGSTPNRSNEEYWNGGSIPWITSTKIHETLIGSADEFVTEKALRGCHLPIVPKGSILVAITGQGKTLGNAAILDFDTCINQHLAYLSIHHSSILPEFVLFYLQGQYARLRQASTAGGTTKGALTCGFLERFSIPRPKLAEQKEIANLMMRLLRRDKVAEQRQRKLTEMFSSILHMLMTGQVRLNHLNLEEEISTWR